MSTDKQKRKSESTERKQTVKKTKHTKRRVSSDKKKIEELTSKLAELEDKHLRLKAEFDNFRRRKEKEILQLMEYEGESIIKKLLPIIDDLERLAEAYNNHNEKVDDSIRKGIELIQNKMKKFLQESQVEPFGTPGEILDAEKHDAMMVKTDNDKRDDEILEVFEKGYRYKDRVIRHAKVIVNKP